MGQVLKKCFATRAKLNIVQKMPQINREAATCEFL
jgi:hypothetical protein